MIDDHDFLPDSWEVGTAPPPNPHFVRKLRGELMVKAAQLSYPTAPGVQPRTSSITRTVRDYAHRPAPRRWDRILTMQVAAVALLLVALIASINTGNRGTGGNHAFIPAPQTELVHVATYRENSARTGVSEERGPQSTPSIAWTQTLVDQQIRALLYADGVVYLVTENSSGPGGTLIQARAVKTGELLWQEPVGWLNEPSLLVTGGEVYVSTAGDAGGGDDGGLLMAFDAFTGEKRWSTRTGGTSYASPVIAGDLMYVMGADHMFRAISATTGDEIWKLDIEKMSAASVGGDPYPAKYSGLQTDFSPAFADGLAFITAGDGVLYAIDVATQSLAWYFQTRGNMVSTPAIVDDSLYLPACNWLNPDETAGPDSDRCWLYKLDAKSGAVVKQVEGNVRLYAATGDRLVVRKDDHTSLLSTTSLNEIAVLPDGQYDPVVTGDTMYLTDAAGSLFAYTYGKTQKEIRLLWSVFTGGPSESSAVLVAEDLLITSGPVAGDAGGSLIALGVSSDATPLPGTATTDLSGLQPCTPPPPVDWEDLTGEPAHTITDKVGKITAEGPISIDPPTADEKRAGYSSAMEPWMDFNAVPAGETASPEAISGIQFTVDEMLACLDRQYQGDVTGFFSDDFFRREYVRFVLTDLNYSNWFAGGVFPTFLQDSTDYRLLPDGRVAILAEPNNPQYVDNFAMFVVFAEQNGHWVVDEVIRVGLGALQG